MRVTKKAVNYCVSFWQSLPLNNKFTIGILAVLVVPVVFASLILFNEIKKTLIERMNNMQLDDLKKMEAFAHTNAEIASTVIQTIAANNQITDFINRTDEISTEELVLFNRNTTPYLENIAVTSPYIRGLRIYCNSERIPERWPVFISSARVSDDDWFNDVKKGKLLLRIGYDERLSSHTPLLSGSDLISYSSALNDKQGVDKAVVEFSFFMEDFFGDLYTVTEDRINYFYTGESFYTNKNSEHSGKWFSVIEELSNKIDYTENTVKPKIISAQSGDYLVSMQKSDVLSGYFVSIYTVDELVSRILEIRTILIVVLSSFIFIIAYIYDNIARVILKRIYETIDAMKKLEGGNVNVQIKNAENDEIGELQKYFNQMVVKINELIEQNSKRALLEKDAEIKALQNQINSHFLYNVLNNIEMMALIDENYLIADTTTALARLLRYSMNWKNQFVPIRAEIEYVKDYIQLFNIRFDDKINLSCNIPETALEAKIPKMSIQPIVENAIIHGIEGKTEEASIYIKAYEEADALCIEITDSGTGIDEETLARIRAIIKGDAPSEKGQTNGIGLRNVQERFELCYGNGYGIEVSSIYGCYTKVKIRIPFDGGMWGGESLHEEHTDS